MPKLIKDVEVTLSFLLVGDLQQYISKRNQGERGRRGRGESRKERRGEKKEKGEQYPCFLQQEGGDDTTNGCGVVVKLDL